MTPEMLLAWQNGKLDVVCAECGRAEAANAQCSNCGHEHEDAEYHVHRTGLNPREGRGSPSPACVLTGCPLPGIVNGGYGDPALSASTLTSQETARRARSRMGGLTTQKRRRSA